MNYKNRSFFVKHFWPIIYFRLKSNDKSKEDLDKVFLNNLTIKPCSIYIRFIKIFKCVKFTNHV